METCCVITHSRAGIRSTVNEMCRMTEELEARDEPIVFVFFGDHKPWMGNGNSVYTEIGVDLDVSTLEGFYNYYATPYVIYANEAARELFGSDFAGDGGDFSPCFLMARLFDECGWEGPGLMQLQREMREVSPLMSSNGWRMQDGQLTAALEGAAEDENNRYLRAQYYIETHLKEDAL